MKPESLICTRDDEYPRPFHIGVSPPRPPGFEHQPSKTVLQSLEACQVSYFREVEGITILHRKENTYGFSLAIRFRESLPGFSFANLRDIVSSKAIDINE